jgi:hypothetical protein
MSTKDPNRVRIHITLNTTSRRALKLVAAARGVGTGDLIEEWAMKEVTSLGLNQAFAKGSP